ncbi:hypothetical protein SUGI_0507800 [Cryptomeria japonica]|nr:hypothetical protein SUGI_0507800 [Cryptomeria japonica]
MKSGEGVGTGERVELGFLARLQEAEDGNDVDDFALFFVLALWSPCLAPLLAWFACWVVCALWGRPFLLILGAVAGGRCSSLSGLCALAGCYVGSLDFWAIRCRGVSFPLRLVLPFVACDGFDDSPLFMGFPRCFVGAWFPFGVSRESFVPLGALSFLWPCASMVSSSSGGALSVI